MAKLPLMPTRPTSGTKWPRAHLEALTLRTGMMISTSKMTRSSKIMQRYTSVLSKQISLFDSCQLGERAFLYQTCRAATRCLTSIAGGAQFCIGVGYLAFIRQLGNSMALDNKGTRMWNFL